MKRDFLWCFLGLLIAVIFVAVPVYVGIKYSPVVHDTGCPDARAKCAGCGATLKGPNR